MADEHMSVGVTSLSNEGRCPECGEVTDEIDLTLQITHREEDKDGALAWKGWSDDGHDNTLGIGECCTNYKCNWSATDPELVRQALNVLNLHVADNKTRKQT